MWLQSLVPFQPYYLRIEVVNEVISSLRSRPEFAHVFGRIKDVRAVEYLDWTEKESLRVTLSIPRRMADNTERNRETLQAVEDLIGQEIADHGDTRFVYFESKVIR